MCERKKWVNIFYSVDYMVDYIFFFVPVLDFNCKCFENDTTYKLDDNLSLFEKIVKSKLFDNTKFKILAKMVCILVRQP